MVLYQKTEEREASGQLAVAPSHICISFYFFSLSLFLFYLIIYSSLTLSGAGMKNTPPSYTFVIPRKKSMGKVANFFRLFLNMRMEGWGLLFAVRLHLVWSGGVRIGQTCLNFISSSRKGK